MTGIKRLQLSLFTVLLSAGVVTSAHAFPLDKRARQHGGFYIQLEPFYAKGADGFLINYPYAVTRVVNETLGITPPVESVTEREAMHTFNIDHEWGYRVAIGYDLPSCTCCNYGFSLEYTYYDVNDKQHLSGFVNNLGQPALFPYASTLFVPGGFFINPYTDVDASLHYKYDTLDLLGHKNFTVCNCVDIQLFSGARYLQYDQGTTNRYSGTSTTTEGAVLLTESAVSIQDFRSKFDGIGPRLGMNGFYPIANGFGLTAQAAGQLLFGDSKNRYRETIEADATFDEIELVFDGEHETPHSRESHIVPGLSGKVGLVYQTLFSNCSSLAIEVGYRGDKYFNLSETSALVQSVLGENSKAHYYHDFDLKGPYISVSYHL